MSLSLKPHPPLTRSPFSEHGEGFFSARSRTHWSLPPRGRCRACEADEVSPGGKPRGVWIFSCPARCTSEQRINKIRTPWFETSSIAFVRAFPRGEGAEPARRMRCHRAKKLRDMDLWLPYEMNQRIKSQQISYTTSQNCDIVSGGMSIFRSLHFGSTFFSSYIRYRSFFLRPHPPLTRSPFSDHGEGFFSARSRTHWSLPSRGRCRACEADEVSPGERTAGYGFSAVLLDVSANKNSEVRTTEA
jgi:hypothetical protein